jgi:D-amino-acid dehydrogenase
MHVIIVGGGLIGVTTGWELVSRGHTVELFEAQDELASETSYANGGMLTAGMCEPWNAPGVWKELVASLFDPKSAMKLHPSAIPGLAVWGLRFLAQSTQSRFNASTQASYRLCAYSVSRTNEWVEQLALECDYRSTQSLAGSSPAGDLKIFQSRAAANFSVELAEGLKQLGLGSQLLTGEETIGLEPALAPIGDEIACGLYYPEDTAGDACQFTRELGKKLVEAGAKVHLRAPVVELLCKDVRIVGIKTDRQAFHADAVVLAAASQSPGLARKAGVALPVKPVKGYSLTLDVRHIEPAARPKLAVINQAMHAAVNPLGERIRIAGTAEFTRTADPVLSEARVENLMDLFRATYPQLASQVTMEHATPWCGFRPMSFDGKPFIGLTKADGLLVNSGHGYLGWTQAAGSAAILVDQLEGKQSAIDASLFAVGR